MEQHEDPCDTHATTKSAMADDKNYYRSLRNEDGERYWYEETQETTWASPFDERLPPIGGTIILQRGVLLRRLRKHETVLKNHRNYRL